MRPTDSRIIALCLGAFLVLTAAEVAAQPSLCIGDGPGNVLRCYEAAYAKRDSASCASLLAPDYVSTDLSYPGQADMDRRVKLELTTRMFRAPNIERLELEFGKPGKIELSQAPGSWVIRDVPCTLRLHGMADMGGPGPWTVQKVVSLWVRVAPEPEPHFLIFREELRDPEEK